MDVTEHILSTSPIFLKQTYPLVQNRLDRRKITFKCEKNSCSIYALCSLLWIQNFGQHCRWDCAGMIVVLSCKDWGISEEDCKKRK